MIWPTSGVNNFPTTDHEPPRLCSPTDLRSALSAITATTGPSDSSNSPNYRHHVGHLGLTLDLTTPTAPASMGLYIALGIVEARPPKSTHSARYLQGRCIHHGSSGASMTPQVSSTGDGKGSSMGLYMKLIYLVDRLVPNLPFALMPAFLSVPVHRFPNDRLLRPRSSSNLNGVQQTEQPSRRALHLIML